LARAAMYRAQSNFSNAWKDLEEAREIAERGSMKLSLVDCHIEACRLHLVQANKGGSDSNLPQQESNIKEAKEHLEIAKTMMERLGYHRRKQEEEELITELKNKYGYEVKPVEQKQESSVILEEITLERLRRDPFILDQFIKRQKGVWNNQDWLGLLDELRRAGFTSFNNAQVGQLLEQRREEWKRRIGLKQQEIKENKKDKLNASAHESRIDAAYKRLQIAHGDSFAGGIALSGLGDALFDAGRYSEALGRYEAASGHLSKTGQWSLYEHVFKRIEECESTLNVNMGAAQLLNDNALKLSTTDSTKVVQLRSQPLEKLSADDVKKMLKEKGFYDGYMNAFGRGLRHLYETIERNEKKLVIDHGTALTWQQSGSLHFVAYTDMKKYILDLNNQRFGDCNDWRLPTLEEAMSLMEQEKKNGKLHIDPVFDREQWYIWTADELQAGIGWGVYFGGGFCSYGGGTSADHKSYGYVRAVRSEI